MAEKSKTVTYDREEQTKTETVIYDDGSGHSTTTTNTHPIIGGDDVLSHTTYPAGTDHSKDK